ncbi:hypothetical protein NL108_008641 [Boleophthalmus pectinirostris]|nr:hypothetical protein NL108_008641 [Boleophthalmus pectinirostris]
MVPDQICTQMNLWELASSDRFVSGAVFHRIIVDERSASSSAFWVRPQELLSVRNVSSTLWVLSGRKLANTQHFRITLLDIEHLCKFGKLNNSTFCTVQETRHGGD